MPPSLRGSVQNGYATSPGTTPKSSALPTIELGDLVVVSVFYAQLTTGNQLSCSLSGLQQFYASAANTRAFAIFAEVVTDLSKYAAGTFTTQHTSGTSTRATVIVEAWAPEAGKQWDPASIAATIDEWVNTSHSSKTYVSPPVADLVLNMAYTNKSANVTNTVHTSNGADVRQATYVAVPSPGADSVLSVARGGSSVTYNTSQANGGAMALTASYIGDTPVDPLPVVTGKSFGSLKKLFQTYGATFAHRSLGLTYPEMTEYATRMAANRGHGVIEISCHRTVDGGWIGSHDATPDRVAVETTYDGQNFNSLTLAQVLSLHANVGSTGAPKPFATLQQLVETLPDDFLFMVDPKSSSVSYFGEFLTLVDTLIGKDRAIIKLDGAGNITRYQQAKEAGFIVAAYFYDSTPAGTISDRMPYTDIPGLNYNADQSYWDALLTYGKPIWGHVCQTQANYDMAIAKGATFVQCTASVINPVGVDKWRPGIVKNGQFGPKEIMVGSSAVKKIYRGSTLEYEASV